ALRYWPQDLQKVTRPVPTVRVHCNNNVSGRLGEAGSSRNSVTPSGLTNHPSTLGGSDSSCVVTGAVVHHDYFRLGEPVVGYLLENPSYSLFLIQSWYHYRNFHFRTARGLNLRKGLPRYYLDCVNPIYVGNYAVWELEFPRGTVRRLLPI